MGRSGLGATDRPRVPDDVVQELDDEPGPPATSGAGGRTPPGRWTRWPAALPAWARGPLGALVLALAVAVVSAGVATVHVRAVEGARLRARVAQAAADAAVLSLQPGDVQVESQGTLADDGWTQVGITVPLVNRGTQVLSVTVLGVTFPHQHTDVPPAQVTLPPGALARVPFVLAVDCPQVPSPNAGSPPGAGGAAPAVRVRLAAAPPRSGRTADAAGGGAARTVRLPLMRQPYDDVTSSLRYACHPDSGDDVSVTWDYPPDGHLKATLTHDGRAPDQPATVALLQSAGLGAVSVPALPLTLAPGASAVVDVSVDPYCPTVGDGASSQLDVVVRDQDGQVERSLGTGYPVDPGEPVQGTTAWLARQVALRCR